MGGRGSGASLRKVTRAGSRSLARLGRQSKIDKYGCTVPCVDLDSWAMGMGMEMGIVEHAVEGERMWVCLGGQRCSLPVYILFNDWIPADLEEF